MSTERGISESDYLAFKSRVLADLIQQLDNKFLDASDAPNLRLRVEALVEQKIQEDKLPYSRSVRLALVTEIADELLGYGPIESALRDPTVSEIMVNGLESIYVERGGLVALHGGSFLSEESLRATIDRMVSKVNRRLDESRGALR